MKPEGAAARLTYHERIELDASRDTVSLLSGGDTAGIYSTVMAKSDDFIGTAAAQEAEMTLNYDELERQLDLDTLQRLGAWSEINHALKQPALFAVDFRPSDFDLEGNRFEGLADVLLTYNDETSGRTDQSITVPATVRGHIDRNGDVVVDGLELAL